MNLHELGAAIDKVRAALRLTMEASRNHPIDWGDGGLNAELLVWSTMAHRTPAEELADKLFVEIWNAQPGCRWPHRIMSYEHYTNEEAARNVVATQNRILWEDVRRPMRYGRLEGQP